MRNPIDPDLPPVTLPEFECGTNDRWLYAAALLMLALVAAAGWVVFRIVR